MGYMGSLFTHKKDEDAYYRCYETSLKLFEADYDEIQLATSSGDTYVLRFGNPDQAPLLLLHGLTMSSTMWHPNVKELIKERCVYAVDIMGILGKSKPAIMIKHRIQAVQWLLDVMQRLRLAEADIAGHSMGGFLAANFALLYPNRVSRLILYSPSGVFRHISLKFMMKITPAFLFRTEWLINRTIKSVSATGQGLHPTIQDQLIAGCRHVKPKLRLLPCVFSAETLHSLSIPTLLVIGDQEATYSARKAINRAVGSMPNLTHHLLAGAGHLLTIEHADIVNALTLRFLNNEGRTDRE